MPKLDWFKKNANVLFFVGGFIFDSLTMVRIDSTLDLLWQLGYLIIITVLMVAQARVDQHHWAPSGRLAHYWEYETEAIHFCYGGLLSGFVVFYFKSTSFSRSLIFLSLMAVLMVGNEMPQVRKWGAQLRVGLYAFCVVSYFNYLLPVLIGRMGWAIFLLSWVLAGVVTFYVMRAVVRYAENPPLLLKKLSISPASVLLLLFVLYAMKLIPPVPLSLQHVGIYRAVEKEGDRYKLTSRKPPWHHFWQTDSTVFLARPGDDVYAFVSVFAPRRFTHQIFIRWEVRDKATHQWLTADYFPMELIGGRAEGFRGFMKKGNYQPGVWRVDVETEDRRVLGSETFRVEMDSGTGERKLRVRWM